jgi:hypothetical protein
MSLEAMVEEQLLVLVKLLSQSITQFSMFIWLNLCTTICCLFHNFVRWATIVCSLMWV